MTAYDAATREPLPGASVTLSNDRKLIAPATLATGADGRALFPILPAGAGYVLDVVLPGYARLRLPGLRVAAGAVAELPLGLVPSREERVVVSGERGVVDLEKTASSTRFGDEFLQELPVLGRLYQNVLTLAPGVLDADGDGNPNVHGARVRDFRATVDGVSNQDPLTGEWMSYVNPDSIESVEVLTAGAGVEFGRAQGGFARVVQKQGSNDFEGVAGALWRSSRIDGNGAADTPVGRVPSFSLFQPSVQVTGPIVRDRLWFRVSHELLRETDPVNTLVGVYVTKRVQGIHADQLTWQVSPRNRLALSFQYDPVRRENVDVSSTLPPSASRREAFGAHSATLTWTAAASPKLLAESIVASQNYRFSYAPMNQGVRSTCLRGFTVLDSFQCTDDESGLTTGTYPESWDDRRQRLSVNLKATWFAGRFLGAVHQVKGGVVVENERYFRSLERNPRMEVFSPKDPFAPNGANKPYFASVLAFAPRESTARATGSNWALYVEDQIRPLPNLVVTAGLRLDHEQIDAPGTGPFDPGAEVAAFRRLVADGTWPPLAAVSTFTAYEDITAFVTELEKIIGTPLALSSNGVQSTFWFHTRRPADINLRNDNFAPRLAVSWDPFSDAKTKLAFTAGRYYDKIFLAVPLVETEPPSATTIFQLRRAAGDWVLGTLDTPVDPAVSVTIVDRHLRTPYQDEITAAVEREIAPETSLKLTWIRRSFRDQLQDVDLNHIPGDFGRCRFTQNPGDVPVVASPGAGRLLVDPYTDEAYTDTDPGPGDGRIDDCSGDLFSPGIVQGPVGPPRQFFVPRPDGIPDLYVQNPAWGDVLLVGNGNSARYGAWVLELVRRFRDGWQIEASYTHSRAVGDAEDFRVAQGNDRTLVDNEYGFLDYDQRHVVKFNGVVLTGWGVRLGTAARWESGLPYSAVHKDLAYYTAPPDVGFVGTPQQPLRTRYDDPHRNGRRNPGFWTIDVRAAKDFVFRRASFQATAEIFNLLNDDTLRILVADRGEITAERRFGRRFQLGLRASF